MHSEAVTLAFGARTNNQPKRRGNKNVVHEHSTLIEPVGKPYRPVCL